MKRPYTFAARLAFVLVRLAARLLPQERAEWANAMSAELHYLNSDYRALLWSIGCLISSVTLRVRTMHIGSWRISRWVLAPEMALCFAPLTVGWFDVVFGGSGVVHLNMDIIERYFLSVPGGSTALATIIAQAVLGVLGPIGLLFGLRAIVLNRPIRNRSLGIAMFVGSMLIAVVFVTNQMILGSIASAWELAGAVILFSVLPGAGVVHMLYLGHRNPSR